MNQEEISHNITRYLSGEMSGKERELFENFIESNPEIKQKLDIEKAVHDTVLSSRMASIINTVKDELPNQHKKIQRNKILKTTAIVLGSIALVGLFSWLIIEPEIDQKESSSTDKELITETRNSSQQVETITFENHSEQENISPDTKQNRNNIEITTSTSKEQNDTSVSKGAVDTIINSEEKKTVISEVVDSLTNTTVGLVETENTETFIERCPDAVQQIKTEVTPENLEEENGSIFVLGDYGLKGDISYELVEINLFENTNEFNGLVAGNYTLVINGDNDCVVEASNVISVPKSGCMSKNSDRITLGISNWELLLDHQRDASIEIRNLTGTVVEQEIQGEGEFSWDGSRLDGNYATPGLYFYTLKYEDNEICSGNITLSN